MITIEQHLLSKISEECGEVVQEVSKAMLHGLEDKKPKQELTNKQKLENELCDLIAVARMCVDRGILDIDEIFNNDKMDIKITKVEKWLKYSQDNGNTET